MDVTFVIMLITMTLFAIVKVVTVHRRPLILRKRTRTARVHVDNGLPKHVSAFLIRRNR